MCHYWPLFQYMEEVKVSEVKCYKGKTQVYSSSFITIKANNVSLPGIFLHLRFLRANNGMQRQAHFYPNNVTVFWIRFWVQHDFQCDTFIIKQSCQRGRSLMNAVVLKWLREQFCQKLLKTLYMKDTFITFYLQLLFSENTENAKWKCSSQLHSMS